MSDTTARVDGPAVDGPAPDIGDVAKNFYVFDPALADNPYPTLHRLVNECPVAHSEMFGGYWIISKHAEILRVLSNPETFSAQIPIIPRLHGDDMINTIPSALDPPELTAYRNMLAPMFSPSVVRASEPRLRAHARALSQKFASAEGPFEFVAEFGIPLPSQALLEMFDLPAEDLERLLHYKDVMITDQLHPDPEVRRKFVEVEFPAIKAYWEEKIAQRRDESWTGTDMLTNLVRARLPGERVLTKDELIRVITTLVGAGLDTTTAQLCMAMIYFAENPDRWAELIEHPDRVPGAVEEMLRVNTNVCTSRLVMKDTELGGVSIAAGEMVLLLNPASSFDGDAFASPDDVDFRRQPNRHLAFSGGAHLCLGATMARAQIRVALEELSRAVPRFRLVPGTRPRRTFGILAEIQELRLEHF